MTANGAGSTNKRDAIDGESARIQSLIADVDRLCTDQRWGDVVELRDTCRLAVARGHQWWPAAAWAEYRIALDGPGELAASVLQSNLSRYTLGPFGEVAASTHSWEELAPYLDQSPASSVFAYECVALGDDLRADERFLSLPAIFDVPGSLQPWEPDYGPVRYHLDRVEHLAPILPTPVVSTGNNGGQSVTNTNGPVESVEDPHTGDALLALVSPWSQSLNWTVASAAFDGSVGDALASGALNAIRGGAGREALNRAHSAPDETARVAQVSSADALRYLAWLAASGGPVGRRRGLASARSALWWVMLQLSGLADDLHGAPVATAPASFFSALTAAVGSFTWFTWSEPTPWSDPTPLSDPTAAPVLVDSSADAHADTRADGPSTQRGWSVHVAVESPTEQMCWLLSVDPLRTPT